MIRSLRENVWEQGGVCGVGVPSESLLLIVNTVIYRHRAWDVIIFSRVLILIILHSNFNKFVVIMQRTFI